VHDGETVLDLPGKLSAQVRVFATGNTRKTDPVDAHSLTMVALRTPNLVQVQVDPDLVVTGMLVDRRDELGRARTQTVNRLHRLLPELLPGRAKQFLSPAQARALVATVKPVTSSARPDAASRSSSSASSRASTEGSRRRRRT
jgi:transposase